MSYLGNPSVAQDVQKRIVETFLHTLDMAESGSLEEARLGCDFVLRLDSLFAPAQALADRLGGASGPVAVADLRQRVLGGEQEAAPPDPTPSGPAPPDPVAAQLVAPESTPPGAVAHTPAVLRSELQTLLEARDLEKLLTRAQAAAAAVTADPGLRALVAQAQELHEAAPYVEGFLGKAREALAAGRLDEIGSNLDKARALDAAHPELGQLEAAATAATGANAVGSQPVDQMQEGIGADEPTQAPGLDSPNSGEGFGTADAELSEREVSGLDPESFAELQTIDLEADGDAGEEAGDQGGVGDLEPPSAPAASAEAGPSDPDPRIAELLDEGQAAFERGELQAAVDAWSRIFLIDIDHAEAARRIDRARDQRAEKERQAEEAYHDALSQAESGEKDAARQGLQQVLELQPGHSGAREALDRLERGEELAALAPDLALVESEGAPGGELKEEILVPPEPGAAVPPPVVAAATTAGRTFKQIGALVLILALGVGGYFYLNRDTWFPNTEPVASAPPPVLPVPEQSPISRAQQQYDEGQRALALARLKRVPPTSPDYQEAQAMIAEWEGADEDPAGVLSEEQQARRQELLEHARQAASERRYLRVPPLLAEAAAIAPLEAAEEQVLHEAEAQLQDLSRLLALVRDGEHELALRDLWLLREQDPTNPDVRTLLVTAYFNRGVLFLQQGRASQAQEALGEAEKLSPEDAEVARLAEFARAYANSQQDLLYRILVKYLAARPV